MTMGNNSQKLYSPSAHSAPIRFTELDAIRGVAALMVVFYHYTIRYGEIFTPDFEPLFNFAIGEYGVQLFFIVSGFVIFLTLDKTRHSIDFIFSRFSRLYPVYWVAVAMTFFVTTFALPERAVDPFTALVNLTMLQQWLGFKSVDGVYWTLAVELAFYCLMYCLFITGLIKHLRQIILLWLSIILLAHFAVTHYEIEIPWIVEHMLLLKHGPLFIAGILFYQLKQRKCAVNYLLLTATLLLELYLYPERLFVAPLFFLIFILFIYGKLGALTIRPLVYLGSISYSLYLIHQNVGYAIMRQLEQLEIGNPIMMIFIPTVISIVIADVLYRLIEKPSLHHLRALWKKSKLRSCLIR